LTEYVEALFEILPTAYKEFKENWKLFDRDNIPFNNFFFLSGGAFVYKSLEEMKSSMMKGTLDFIFAFEFKIDGTPSIVHILLSEKSNFLSNILTDIVSQFSRSLKIKIY